MDLDRSIPNEFWEYVPKATNGVLRLGQFFDNFHLWIKNKKGKDPFYVENQEYCEFMKEYTDEQTFV